MPPLKCLLDGTTLLSFTMGEDEWAQLKASHSSRELVMPCCGIRAIPKVSKLGTRFFAHKPGANCGSEGESAQHLRAKWIIARAALAAGWSAETEVAGVSPTGEQWIADVLCTRGNAKVAFEVQLSRQSQLVRDQRQARYAASGIRACWLSTYVGELGSRDTPDFHLNRDNLRVSIRRLFSLELDTFVQGALNGSLHWYPGDGGEHPVWVSAYEDCCHNCGALLLLVDGVSPFVPGGGILLAQAHDFMALNALIGEVAELRRANPDLTPVGWVNERRVGPNHPDPDRGGIRVRQLRTAREIEETIRQMMRWIPGGESADTPSSREPYRFFGALCQHCGAAFDDMYALNAPERQTARRVSFAIRPVRLVPASRRGGLLSGWAWRQPAGTCIETRPATPRTRIPGEDDDEGTR